jgi:transmembrane sensor
MAGVDDRKRDEAAAWVVRLRDPATADWEGFTAWLEADPAHNDLYEAVALTDRDYGELIAASPPSPASNDNPPAPRPGPRRLALWVSAAAAVAAAIGYPLLTAPPATYAVETPAGRHNSVRLADGTRIDLNGGSRITLRKTDNRYASLERGEATFTVIHDPAHPFTVHVGDDVIQDVGTVFNVIRDKDMLEAAVSSGAIVYNPDDDAVRIAAGQVLRLSARDKTATVSPIEATDVAAWRSGRLIYKRATLQRVAADLSRNLGMPVRISPDIADRPFSGVIMLGGDRAALLPRVGAMLDVTISREGDGWRLSSRSAKGD